jgi:hypothetical protein
MDSVKYLISNIHRVLCGALPLACTAFLSSGCAQTSGAVAHGWEGTEYEHTYLSVKSPLGAKALRNWKDLDLDVRQFLRTHRDPDVIYSKMYEVTLFYLKERVQVNFDRPALGFKTKIEQSRISESLYQTLRRRFE